jgi:hypothetical protein
MEKQKSMELMVVFSLVQSFIARHQITPNKNAGECRGVNRVGVFASWLSE